MKAEQEGLGKSLENYKVVSKKKSNHYFHRTFFQFYQRNPPTHSADNGPFSSPHIQQPSETP